MLANDDRDALTAILAPGGIRVSGGAGIAAGIRSGPAISPEKATNWDLGFNFAPTEFLPGEPRARAS